jgi:hypothetical protein
VCAFVLPGVLVLETFRVLLLITIHTRVSLAQYLPTIGDMYTKDVEVAGAPRHIQIDDTAGQVRVL